MAATQSYRLTLGREFSEGARRLWLWLDQNGKRQADLYRLLGQTGGAPSKGLLPRWLYGDLRISVIWARRLETVTGVAAGLWGEDPHEEFVPPARAAAENALRASAAA